MVEIVTFLLFYYYRKNISFTDKPQIMRKMIEINRMLFILYLLRNMFELKSEKMNLTTKLIIFGSLLGIAGGIGLYLYRNRRISTPTSPLKPHLIPNIQERQETPQKTFARVINTLKKQINSNSRLTNDTIKIIFRSQFQLSKRQFKQTTIKNRQQRRKALGDITSHQQLVANYEQNIVELHNKHLDAVLAHFKIDKTQWIEAVNELSINGAEQWDAFLLDTQREQFENMRKKDKPKISMQILEAISKFKISKINQSTTIFKEIIDIQKSDLYSLIEKWIQDSIFLIFKCQIQDINFSVQQLNQSQQKVIESYEDQYCELVQVLVFEDSEIISEK